MQAALAQRGALEIGAGEVCRRQVRALEIGAAQGRLTQVGAAQVNPGARAEDRPRQRCATRRHAVDGSESSRADQGGVEPRTPQITFREIDGKR